jgi:hypothetical protein
LTEAGGGAWARADTSCCPTATGLLPLLLHPRLPLQLELLLRPRRRLLRLSRLLLRSLERCGRRRLLRLRALGLCCCPPWLL